MTQAPRDENRITTMIGTSYIDGRTPVVIYADPVTNSLFTTSSSAGGTNPIASYQVNHLDDGSTAANVLYVGLAKDDGTYCIKKLDETSSTLPVVTYATITNNVSVTTYDTAWSGRASLTYNKFETAF